MKNWFKYLVSVFVVGVFLLSTSGFTIYSHHCSVAGTTYSYSFVKSMANCEQCNVESPPKEASCCSVIEVCSTTTTKDNCCENDSKYLKINVDFTIPSYEVNNSVVNLDVLTITLIDNHLKEDITQDEGLISYSLPPPKKRADIIILLNQRKTAPAPLT